MGNVYNQGIGRVVYKLRRGGNPPTVHKFGMGGIKGFVDIATPLIKRGIDKAVKKVVPAKEDMLTVLDSNFVSGRVIGNEMAPIDSLKGGSIGTGNDLKRVKDLVEEMRGPEGYVERLIVDQEGNVIEGQHRLSALRELGQESVPITRVADDFEGLDLDKVREAIGETGIRNKDQQYYVIKDAAKMLREEGSVKGVLDAYENADMEVHPAHISAMKSMESQQYNRLQRAKEMGVDSSVLLKAKGGLVHKFGMGGIKGFVDTATPLIEKGVDKISKAVSEAELPAFLRAYHGSPSDFDKFDMSKIGTGEGAQAYGRGLYLAEREPTAQYYRDSLTERNFDFEEYLSKEYKKSEQTGDYVRMQMLESAMLHDTPNDFRNKSVDTDYGEDYRRMASDFAEEMESFRDSKGDKVNFGKMYEVDIDASPDKLLDYDLPLSEQSGYIKNNPIIKKLMQGDADYAAKYPHSPIGERHGGNVLTTVKEDDLLASGIKGIKYLDQQSRDPRTGDPTSNFVIFDDTLLDIKRKYKQGGSVYKQGIGTLARKLQKGGEAKPVYEYGYTPTELKSRGIGSALVEPFIPFRRERLEEENVSEIKDLTRTDNPSIFIDPQGEQVISPVGYNPETGEGAEFISNINNPNQGTLRLIKPPVYGKAEAGAEYMPLVQGFKKARRYIQDIIEPETRTEALKKGASTVGAVGKALAEIPRGQIIAAGTVGTDYDKIMDPKGETQEIDPFLVPALAFGAGTALKVAGKAITDGDPNSVILGSFVGRQASNLTDEQRQAFQDYEKREREINRKMKAEGKTQAYIERERLKIDEQLRQETGVFRGVDGQLRFEISDKAAKSRSFDELPEGVELKQFPLKNIPDAKKAIEYLKDKSNFIDNPYQRENMFAQLASSLKTDWSKSNTSPMKSSSIYDQTKDNKDLMSKDIDVLGVKFRLDEIESFSYNSTGRTYYQLYTHKDPNKRFTPIRKDEVSPEDMRLVYQSNSKGLKFLETDFFNALNPQTRQYEIGDKKMSTSEFAESIYDPEYGDKFPTEFVTRGFGLKAFVLPTLDETGKLDNLIEGLDQKTLERNQERFWRQNQMNIRNTLNLLVDTDEATLLDTKTIAKEMYKKGVNIGQFLTHDELFKIYPSLKKTKLVLDEREGSALASFDASRNTITIKNLKEFEKGMQGKGFLLHELMHNIQELENFGRGGNPQTVQGNLRETLRSKIDAINKELKQGFEKTPALQGSGKTLSIDRVTIRQFDDADKSDIRLQTLRNEEQSRKWRELSNRENITPRRVTSQQEWYRLGDVVRSEIGPMPKRSGREQKDWLRKSSSIMERLQKDNYNVYSDRKDLFRNLDRLDKKEKGTVSYTQGRSADYRNKVDGLVKDVRDEAEGMTDKELAKAVREASKKFSETRVLNLDRDRLINSFNEMKYEDPFQTYKRLAGEVEARLVQLRMDFSPEDLKYYTPSSDRPNIEAVNPTTWPWASSFKSRKYDRGYFGMDVPRKKQFVTKRNMGGVVPPLGNNGQVLKFSAGGIKKLVDTATPFVEKGIGSLMDKIRPAEKNLLTVLGLSNKNNKRVVGDEMVPIDSLNERRFNHPDHAKRIGDLIEKMARPDGYVERLIIDQDDSVVKGQHRLQALRGLGETMVPVTRVTDDFAPNFDDLRVKSYDQAQRAKEMRRKKESLYQLIGNTEQRLPMDNASRMKRAEEMGFSMDAYHGTIEDIDKFETPMYGKSSKLPDGMTAFTDNPIIAETYTTPFGIPTRKGQQLNRQEQKIFSDFDSPTREKDLEKIKKEEDLERASLVKGQVRGSNIIPVKLRLKNPMIIDADNRPYTNVNKGGYKKTDGKYYSRDPNNEDAEILSPVQEKAITINEMALVAQEAGHDGLIVKRVVDSASPLESTQIPATTTIVFDPSNIRSRFAEFDPAKKDLSGLNMKDGGVVPRSPLAMMGQAYLDRGKANLSASEIISPAVLGSKAVGLPLRGVALAGADVMDILVGPVNVSTNLLGKVFGEFKQLPPDATAKSVKSLLDNIGVAVPETKSDEYVVAVGRALGDVAVFRQLIKQMKKATKEGSTLNTSLKSLMDENVLSATIATALETLPVAFQGNPDENKAILPEKRNMGGVVSRGTRPTVFSTGIPTALRRGN